MLEHLTNKYDIEDMLTKFSYSVVKTGQIPSANGQCSARGIARVAAMLANRGELEVFVWYFDFGKGSLQGRNRRGAGWRFPKGLHPSAISRGPIV